MESVILETEYLSEKVGGLISGKNWLGRQSGCGAAQINALLLVGATWEQLESCRGAVENHLRDLEKEFGLQVEARDGIYKFKFKK